MDERTPLLASGPQNQTLKAGPLVSHAEVTVLDGQPTVNCQVCDRPVLIENLEKQLFVRCPICFEATPIKGPPDGKQYVRCPCNGLLICNASTSKVGCPRPSCQKVIVLHETGVAPFDRGDALSGGPRVTIPDPYNPGGTFGTPPNLRVLCGSCGSPFCVATTHLATHSRQSKLIACLSGGAPTLSTGPIAARCPRCHKLTSVGPAFARFRLAVYGLLTLLTLIVAVSVTVGTVEAAKQKKALYFLWSVLYLLVLGFGIRAVMFLLMPVSSVEVPVLQL